MMKLFYTSLLLFIFLIQPLFSQEVSQWRGPNRDGIYPEKDLLTEWPKEGPKLLWKYEGLGIGYATVSVTSDIVLTAGTIDSINYIFSFDINGNLLWKKNVGPAWMVNYPGVRSTPLIYNKFGYYLNSSGKLFCFNLSNGDTKWSINVFKDFDGKNNTWGITENLLIDGDVLFCTPGGAEANVIALNRITGDLIWKSKGNGNLSAYCSPKLIEFSGKKFMITMTSESIISINIENGDLAWKYPILNRGDGHANVPICRNDSLFFIRGYQDRTLMLKITKGGYSVEEIWSNELLDMAMGDAVLIGDNIYSSASTKNGKLYTLDWKTGQEIYSEELFSTGRIKGGSIISADGLIYCYGFSGKLLLLKPTKTGFKIISSFQVGDRKNTHWAHPVIKNGKLYIRYDNTLYVYSIGH